MYIYVEARKCYRLIVIFLILSGFATSGIGQEQRNRESAEKLKRESTLYNVTLKAKSLLDNGEVLKVIEICNIAYDSLYSGPDSHYLGYVNLYKGCAYLRAGNYYLAKKCLLLATSYGVVFQENILKLAGENDLLGLAIESGDKASAEKMYLDLMIPQPGLDNNQMEYLGLMSRVAMAIVFKDTVAGKRIFEKITIDNNSGNYLLERNFGVFQMMLGQPLVAINQLKRALKKCILVNGTNHYQTALCLFHLGNCYLKINKRASAEYCYLKSYKILAPVNDREEWGQVQLKRQYETVLLECLIRQGDLYSEKPEDLKLALGKFKEAIGRILFLSHSITSEMSRFIIAEKGRKAFDGGIASALRLYWQTKEGGYFDQALEWSLQSKSLSLNWLTEKDLIYNAVGIPSELTSHLQSYRRVLDNLLRDTLDNMISVPMDSIGKVLRLYEKTENQIRDKYDEIREKVNAAPIIDRVAGRIINAGNYLGYYDLESVLLVFTVSGKKRDVIEIPKDSLLKAEINQFKQFVSNPPFALYSTEDVLAFSKLSAALYAKLVGCTNMINASNELIIHPDGILLGFPFEALTTAVQQAENFKDLPFLLKKYQIRYVTTPLLVNPGIRPDKKRSAISIITCIETIDTPEVKSEVVDISKLYRNAGLFYLDQIGADRTFSNSLPLLIHISSHLRIDNSAPYKSEIRCSGFNSKGINFRDIMDVPLAESQVYINACESGNGPMNHGEGLMSIGFAFSMAGCTTIIQQNWNAPDKSSAQIAKNYYRNLGYRSPAEALTKAKRNYIKSSESGDDHPYYWAGVVCYSNIRGSKNYWHLIYLSLSLLIAGSIVYLICRNQSH